MRALGAKALAAIARYDAEHRVMPRPFRVTCTENRTRYYHWLIPRGNDVEVHTVAAKAARGGVRMVKEVERASACGARMSVRQCVAYGRMNGYVTDWSEEGIGTRQYWSGGNESWDYELYSRRSGMWKLGGAVVNPEALLRSKRWRYCAWRPECGHILDYLKMYKEHPKVEMLAKCGVGEFATLSGFVKRLERDKNFMRFFSQRLEEIKGGGYMANDIVMSYRRKIPLEAARYRVACGRRFGKLPQVIDCERAAAYVDSQRGASPWEYKRYLASCVRLGINIADTKNAYPKSFAQRQRAVSDRIAALERKASAALREKKAKELLERAEKYAALERAMGPYVARIPRTEEDFEREGDEKTGLDHCVASYVEKMSRGECLIVCVRTEKAPDVPFVTVEFDPAGTKVRQCYGKKNSKPADDVLEFVKGPLLKAVKRCAAAASKKSKVAA